ncbi:MAG: hypothetical protein HOO96_36805 [Polyangiaceae bacterium]|nr:hypothetical protein [Polyangiaceae bacterium]
MGEEPAPSIAAAIGVPVGTVASRLRRGRAELKKRLRGEPEQPALPAVIWAFLRRPRAWLTAAPAPSAPLGGAMLAAAVAFAVVAQPPANASGTLAVRPATIAPSVTVTAGARTPPATEPATAPPTVDFQSLPKAPPPTSASLRPQPNDGPNRVASVGDLEKEATDLQGAHARLAAGDPAGALALVENWTVRHAHAVLTEDAAAVEITATAQVGRKERACALATAFRDRWPQSMHTARILRACPTVTP